MKIDIKYYLLYIWKMPVIWFPIYRGTNVWNVTTRIILSAKSKKIIEKRTREGKTNDNGTISIISYWIDDKINLRFSSFFHLSFLVWHNWFCLSMCRRVLIHCPLWHYFWTGSWFRLFLFFEHVTPLDILRSRHNDTSNSLVVFDFLSLLVLGVRR